ncbi:MAG: TerC/Alx family metal homeostasis membrane protein [Chitinophagaceae bacterium]|nr:TerC/Alx family metal homeostasis membrane protein [Chitinophagaceae bacterium]
MNSTQWTYIVFALVLLVAIIFDLGLVSKKSRTVTIKQAFYQTIFWIGLALAFFVFLWYQDGQIIALEYVSAYLMEWSLSIDNIFVFILIFSFFGIHKEYYGRVLLLGILMAIIFRIIFITIGIVLVAKFSWILYIFGAFLVYTGVKMFFVDHENNFDPNKNKVYIFLKKILPVTSEDAGGRFTKKIKGKKYFTLLFIVVVLLATTDIVFAVDSIPAVFAITQNKLVIYTSNIFAVLGLRSLFFLLRGAVSKFDYLQQGIAIVLIFIGTKMLIEHFYHINIIISLGVIIACLMGSIVFSIYHKKIDIPEDEKD